MYTVILDDTNTEDYAGYLGADLAEDLERTFFRGLVLVEDGQDKPLGWMVWELKNLESSKDTESYIRSFEAGDEDEAAALFASYNKLIAENGVVKSHVIIPATKESSGTRQILAGRGFDMLLLEGDDVTVMLPELLAMPIFQKEREISIHVHSLENMTLRTFKKTIAKLDSLGQKGTCEDLSYLPMGYFDQKVSCFYEGEDGIRGVLLFHMTPSGKLCIKVMRAISGSKKEATQTLLQLLVYAVEYMKEYCPEDTQIVVDRHNDAAFLLAEKLFPRGFGCPVYGGSRIEKG